MLRKHCDTTGTQVADRLTDCERAGGSRRVRARGRIAVGAGVGRGGVARGPLGRGSSVGGAPGWGSRGKARAWRGPALPILPFPLAMLTVTPTEQILRSSLLSNPDMTEFVKGGTKNQPFSSFVARLFPFQTTRHFLRIMLTSTLLWIVVYRTAYRAFHRDTKRRVQRYTLRLIDPL